MARKDRLPCLGAVVVLRHGDDVVRYASVRPDEEHGWPKVYPWPGQTIPSTHPLRNVRPGQALRRRTSWTMPWGRRADFYMDALADSRRTIAVFSAEDIWHSERFHPAYQRDFDHRPRLEVHCCGRDHGVRGWPCETCGEGYCPTCGNCRCQKQAAAEVLCAGSCYLKYLPHLLVNGLCESCR